MFMIVLWSCSFDSSFIALDVYVNVVNMPAPAPDGSYQTSVKQFLLRKHSVSTEDIFSELVSSHSQPCLCFSANPLPPLVCVRRRLLLLALSPLP